MPFSDTFTNTAGTLLQAHGSYAKVTGVTGDAQITAANRLRCSAAATAMYNETSFTPASADYDVTGDWVNPGTVSAVSYVGTVGRSSAAAFTSYAGYYDGPNGRYVLQRTNAGTPTILASSTAAFVAGTYMLRMRGSVITLLRGTAVVLTVTDGSPITDVGRGGIFLYDDAPTDSNGYQLDNLAIANPPGEFGTFTIGAAGTSMTATVPAGTTPTTGLGPGITLEGTAATVAATGTVVGTTLTLPYTGTALPGEAVRISHNPATSGLQTAAGDPFEELAYETVTNNSTATGINVYTPRRSKVTGHTEAITWFHVTVAGNVDVELSLDNGGTWPYLLATVAASKRHALFWLEAAHVAAACKIRIRQAGVTLATTGAFAIVAESDAVLRPVMAAGAGATAVTVPTGNGAVPHFGADVYPGESRTGVSGVGVGALSAGSDACPLPMIETVQMRANGGAWVNVPRVTLNSDGRLSTVRWVPASYPFGDPTLVRLPLQEWVARFDFGGVAAGAAVTFDAVVWPYAGQPSYVTFTVHAEWAAAGAVLYVNGTTGSDANPGTVGSPKLTIRGAMIQHNTNGTKEGGVIELQGTTAGKLDSANDVISTVFVTRPMHVRSAAGAWETAKIVSADDNVLWQVSRAVIECVVDGTKTVGGANWGVAVGAAGVPSIVWKGAELRGPGSQVRCAGWTNGVAEYFRDVYSHGWGTPANLSANPNYMQGVSAVGTYVRDNAGLVFGGTALVLGCAVKDHAQHFLDDQGAVIDQHSSMLARGGVGYTTQCIVGLIADNCYRHLAITIQTDTNRNGLINADFDARAGDANRAETDFSLPGNLIMYMRTGHSMYVGKRTPSDTEHSQVWGVVYGALVDLAFGGTPSPFPYHNYSHFVIATPTGDNATTGALSYVGRRPSTSGGSFDSGLPLWPYDVTNQRRGLYSTGHRTAKGPQAAAEEYITSQGARRLVGPSVLVTPAA